jgi:hypothetical protein
MKYVYGCTADKDHPRAEVVHGMNETVQVFCSVCRAPMRRVPQPFVWGHRPIETLNDQLEERYRKNRYRRSLQ